MGEAERNPPVPFLKGERKRIEQFEDIESWKLDGVDFWWICFLYFYIL
jgi:hypothetical protein